MNISSIFSRSRPGRDRRLLQLFALVSRDVLWYFPTISIIRALVEVCSRGIPISSRHFDLVRNFCNYLVEESVVFLTLSHSFDGYSWMEICFSLIADVEQW